MPKQYHNRFLRDPRHGSPARFCYLCRMQFFRKKIEGLENFSTLGVDFHNHVLPGIDDGSPTLEESLKMLQLWIDMGFKKIITSPHVITALYPNTKDIILGQMHHLKEVIDVNNMPIELEATAEYRLDFEFLERMEKGELLPFGPNNFILIELPFQKPAFSIEEIIFEIESAGYQPILAHPERYIYLYSDFKKYQAMKDRGLLFQLNANSLNGFYNGLVKRTAEKLIKNNLIEFICSDAHHCHHLTEMNKLLKNRHFNKLLESNLLRNIELS